MIAHFLVAMVVLFVGGLMVALPLAYQPDPTLIMAQVGCGLMWIASYWMLRMAGLYFQSGMKDGMSRPRRVLRALGALLLPTGIAVTVFSVYWQVHEILAFLAQPESAEFHDWSWAIRGSHAGLFVILGGALLYLAAFCPRIKAHR